MKVKHIKMNIPKAARVKDEQDKSILWLDGGVQNLVKNNHVWI